MLRKSRKPKAINPMAKQPRRPRTPVGKRPTPKLPNERPGLRTKQTKPTPKLPTLRTNTPTKKTTPTGKLSKMAEKLKPSNSMLLRKGKPVNRQPISTRRHPIHKLGRGMTGTVKR